MSLFVLNGNFQTYLQPLARLGATVLGIDPTPGSIDAAKAHLDLDPGIKNSVTYEAVEPEQLLSRSVKFDAVVASEVVEHVKDYTLFVRTCAALTKVRRAAVQKHSNFTCFDCCIMNT